MSRSMSKVKSGGLHYELCRACRMGGDFSRRERKDVSRWDLIQESFDKIYIFYTVL